MNDTNVKAHSIAHSTTLQPQNASTSRREALNESHVWQVYARRKYEDPLYEIGNVMADDVELAKVYARSIYDEFTWIEMVLVPRDTIVTVIAS